MEETPSFVAEAQRQLEAQNATLQAEAEAMLQQTAQNEENISERVTAQVPEMMTADNVLSEEREKMAILYAVNTYLVITNRGFGVIDLLNSWVSSTGSTIPVMDFSWCSDNLINTNILNGTVKLDDIVDWLKSIDPTLSEMFLCFHGKVDDTFVQLVANMGRAEGLLPFAVKLSRSFDKIPEGTRGFIWPLPKGAGKLEGMEGFVPILLEKEFPFCHSFEMVTGEPIEGVNKRGFFISLSCLEQDNGVMVAKKC